MQGKMNSLDGWKVMSVTTTTISNAALSVW
jgi:hypothetical protein